MAPNSIDNLVSGEEWPRLLHSRLEKNEADFSFEIIEEISWFEGHFPEQAVLPGVVQLHWATKLAEISFLPLLEGEKCFKAVNNIKFKTMVLPGQVVDLSLRYDELKCAVKFSYHNVDDTFSTGTLIFT